MSDTVMEYNRIGLDKIQDRGSFDYAKFISQPELDKYLNGELGNTDNFFLKFLNNMNNKGNKLLDPLFDLAQIENKIINSNNDEEFKEAISLLGKNISENEKNIQTNNKDYVQAATNVTKTLLNKDNIINELSIKDGDLDFLFAVANYQIVNAKKILEVSKYNNQLDFNTINEEVSKLRSDEENNFDKIKEKVSEIIQQIKQRYIKIKFAYEKYAELHEFAANIISMSIKMNNATISNIR